MDLTKGYQPEKFQCCKLSKSSLTEELQKHNDDVIMSSLRIFGISIFYETAYKLSSCQVSNSSIIWIKFYRGFYKTPKKNPL